MLGTADLQGWTGQSSPWPLNRKARGLQAETPEIIGEQGRSHCLRGGGRINSARQPT